MSSIMCFSTKSLLAVITFGSILIYVQCQHYQSGFRPSQYYSSKTHNIKKNMKATSDTHIPVHKAQEFHLKPFYYKPPHPDPEPDKDDDDDKDDKEEVIKYFDTPKYHFKYSVEDLHTGDVHSHEEERDGDKVKGYYTLNEPDGTIRIVHYTVDKHSGFNAVVEKKGFSEHPSEFDHHY